MSTYIRRYADESKVVSDFYFHAPAADSNMFGFQEWCEENNIKYWTDGDNKGMVIIYFEEDTDMMAAKLRWA